MLRINLELLQLLSGSLVPLVTGAVTHWSASSRAKALVNVTLSAVAAISVSALGTAGVLSKQTLLGFGLAYAASIISYGGFWSKTGVSDVLQYRFEPGILKDHDTIDQMNKTAALAEDFAKQIAAGVKPVVLSTLSPTELTDAFLGKPVPDVAGGDVGNDTRNLEGGQPEAPPENKPSGW